MLIRNLYIAVVVAVFALPAYASGVDVGAAEAENAIMSFFSAVSSGDYAAADDYYGGTYAALQEWNPDLDPIDLALLVTMWVTAAPATARSLHCTA